MKMRVMLWIIALVVGQVWCHSALGDQPAIDLGQVFMKNQLGGYVMCWEFTLDNDIEVTALGVWDDVDFGQPAGFSQDHHIGIYRRSGGERLAHDVISDPIGAIPLNDQYRYKTLAEYVTLRASEGPYVMACWTPAPDPISEEDDYHVLSAWYNTNPEYDYIVNPGTSFAFVSESGLPETLIDTGSTEMQLFSGNFLFRTPGITIDIKPGSYPNCINLGSNGVVPVAILSSLSLEATTVDPATVYLAGADVAMRGKGNRLMAHYEDVNGDGLVDLVVQVETENLDPDTFQDGYARLTVELDGEVLMEGWDEITIVPVSPE